MQTPVLSRQDAATYLSNQGYSIKKSTLQKLASVGGGPRYRIFGNRAIYMVDDLDAWLQTKIGPYRSSTSAVVAPEIVSSDLQGPRKVLKRIERA